MRRRPWQKAAAERGMTLIEAMVTLAVMSFLMIGTLMFVITQAKMSVANFDKSDIQRGGRAAVTILEDKISIAGLGLPRALAIKSFNPAADCTVPDTILEIAALDHIREWTISATNGGSITLSSADPVPPKPASMGGGSNDMLIPVNRWLFLYQNTNPGGHGLARVGAVRAAGVTALTIASTNYNASQTVLDLTAGSAIDAAVAGPSAMLLVNVSGFGVDCTDANHPYLFWSNNDTASRTPVARNVDIRALAAANPAIDAGAGAVVALRFRFLLDRNADGLPDDLNTNGVFDSGDFSPTLVFDSDPLTASSDDVVGIEVLVRIRSDKPGNDTGEYRLEDFVRVVETPNIHTRTTGFIFVNNAGI